MNPREEPNYVSYTNSEIMLSHAQTKYGIDDIEDLRDRTPAYFAFRIIFQFFSLQERMSSISRAVLRHNWRLRRQRSKHGAFISAECA